MVRGHHVHRDLGRLALPRDRDRHRLPPRRRVRAGRSPAHRARRRRPGQRGRRPRPRTRRDLPLRPRLPVHLRRVRCPRRRLPGRLVGGPQGPVLGQDVGFILHLLVLLRCELAGELAALAFGEPGRGLGRFEQRGCPSSSARWAVSSPARRRQASCGHGRDGRRSR